MERFTKRTDKKAEQDNIMATSKLHKLATELEHGEERIKRSQAKRKQISNIYLSELIALHDSLVKSGEKRVLKKIKSSGQWFMASYSAQNRFMLFIAIEQLKHRVCESLVELEAVAARVQWKEKQLWSA